MHNLLILFIVITSFLSSCDYKTTLAEPKQLGAHSIPETNIKASIMTSWREGKLYYIARIEPYTVLKSNRIFNDYEYIEFDLLDKGGFKLQSISMLLSDFSPVIDKDKKPKYLEYQGEVNCSVEIYRDLANSALVLANH